MHNQQSNIEITTGAEAGIYKITDPDSKKSVITTSRGMLDIAAWVEQHRVQLRKEAGQDITRYRVELRKSSVIPVGSQIEVVVDAADPQEAASRALLQYGAQRMVFVVVMSSSKKTTFYNVELQSDHSFTFESYSEDLQPQPPFAPPFDPDKPSSIN